VVNIGAQEFHQFPSVPLGRTKVLVCLNKTPCCCKQQGPGEIGCCIVQNSWRIRHHNFVTGACRNINVVVSNGYIRDNLEVWALGKDGLINPIREQDDRTCLALKPSDQLFGGKSNISLIILHIKMLLDNGDGFIEDLTGDQNLWPHDIFSLFPKKRRKDNRKFIALPPVF
jgi:hypothetical protein